MISNLLNSPMDSNPRVSGLIDEIVHNSIPTTGIRRKDLLIVTDKSNFAKNSIAALCKLQNHFENLNIYNLGSMKNENPEFVITLLRELVAFEGRIIMLSQNTQYLDSIFRALEFTSDHLSLAYFSNSLDQMLDERTARSLQSSSLLNLSALGYQRHFCSPKVLSYIHESFVHHLSLGQLDQDVHKAEPILRSVNATAIDTNVIKNVTSASPNGLTPLQMCQISKYLGMNPSMKVLGVSNQPKSNIDQIEPIIAQLLWYYIEGVSISDQDNQLRSQEYFQEHLVKTDYSNQSFTFWKSTKTNRWWFEIPNAEGEKGNIYPCNKEDYDLACRNEISAYLIDQMNLDH